MRFSVQIIVCWLFLVRPTTRVFLTRSSTPDLDSNGPHQRPYPDVSAKRPYRGRLHADLASKGPYLADGSANRPCLRRAKADASSKRPYLANADGSAKRPCLGQADLSSKGPYLC